MKNQQGSEGQNKHTTLLIIIVAAAVIMVALAVIVVVKSQMPVSQSPDMDRTSDNSEVKDDPLGRGFVESNNADTIVSDMEDKVAEGMFECKMTTKWTFKNGTSESPNAYVANVESNRYTFYFDVYLADTDELVYSSPLVPVGSELKGVTLDKDLDAGEYSMEVRYTLVDENYEEVSNVGFMIKAFILE